MRCRYIGGYVGTGALIMDVMSAFALGFAGIKRCVVIREAILGPKYPGKLTLSCSSCFSSTLARSVTAYHLSPLSPSSSSPRFAPSAQRMGAAALLGTFIPRILVPNAPPVAPVS